MTNVNEHVIELKRFFKEMPVTASQTTVGFKRLTDTAVIPTKAHPTDSGFDLRADVDRIIRPGETVVITTGIAVKLPAGYEAQVRPRSGITAKTKLRVQLGTIDQSYIGDIGIIVDNISQDINIETFTVRIDEPSDMPNMAYRIRKGDKLAQLVVSPVATFAGVEVTDLDDTARGSNGFGSTGV